MKTLLTSVASLAIGCLVSSAWAQEAPREANKPDSKPAAQAAAKTLPQLRAEMHRTMAALIEAQAAEKPDQAKIRALAEQVQKLRREMFAQAPATAAQARGWLCPGGGPWYGRGWGGPGCGRGPAWGGPGYGRGWGGGPGYGRGLGLGAGLGPGFLDADLNGLCDNYEFRMGLK